MVKSRDSDRSALAIGWQWASRITNVSLTVIVPIALGWWGDRHWGIGPWLMIVGAVVGMAAGAMSLRQLVQDLERADGADSDRKNESPE